MWGTIIEVCSQDQHLQRSEKSRIGYTKKINLWQSQQCCCSGAKSRPTLCNPMNCSTPGFPVLHYLLEFAQKHVHWVSDAIQPSHPLSPPFPPAPNPSQHQGLFQWVGSSHQWPKYWSFSFKHQSFQWIFGTNFLSDHLVWSPCCTRNSQESSSTTIRKH